MIVDHGLELVLLHVPKCAGTSLRQAFLEDAKAGGREVLSCFDFAFDTILQRQVDLAHITMMVLDEADKMLELGFEEQLDKARSPHPGPPS